MNAHLECIACITRQTLEVAKDLFNEPKEQEHILRKSMEKLLELEWDMTSQEMVNDATVEDAKSIGIDKIPNLKLKKIGNGDEGTGPSRNSEEVKRWIEKNDLIISKGQANFEGLNNFSNIFFLLIAKCNLIAALFDVKVNTLIIKHNYDLEKVKLIY